jgi:hypothetical protein
VFEFKADLDVTIRDWVDFGEFLARLLDGTVLFHPYLQKVVDKAIIFGEYILFAQV